MVDEPATAREIADVKFDAAGREAKAAAHDATYGGGKAVESLMGDVDASGRAVGDRARQGAQAVGETGRRAGETVAGTGVVVGQGINSAGRAVGDKAREGVQGAGQALDSAGRAVGETGRRAGDTVVGTGRAVGQGLDSAGRTVGDKARQGAQAVGETGQRVGEAASEGAERAKEGGKNILQKVRAGCFSGEWRFVEFSEQRTQLSSSSPKQLTRHLNRPATC